MSRPADACPYPKPFTADFDECPAYQARHLIVRDSTGQPLKTIWSCRLLTSRSVDGEPGHFYGACGLGDAAARVRWAQEIGPERIRAIHKLRSRVVPLAQAFMDDVSELMVRADFERTRQSAQPILSNEMHARAAQYVSALEAMLGENPELVEAAQMPISSVVQIARQWAEELISETLMSRSEDERISADLLQSLPESVRVFYGA